MPGSPISRFGPRSLAARITFLTFTIITTFALVAAVLALLGVSRMARQESQARLAAYDQIVVDAVGQRLGTADRLVDSVVGLLAGNKAPESIRPEVLRLASANNELFDLIAIVDTNGRVRVSVPNGILGATVAGQTFFKPVTPEGGTLFVWQSARGATGARVWMLHPVTGADGKLKGVLIARLHVGFLKDLVNATSSRVDARAALVLDPKGQLIERGSAGPAIDLRSASFVPTSKGRGDVQVAQPDLGLMRGIYTDVMSGPDALMRVVVAEPDSLVFERSGGALIPAGIVIFLGALVFAVAAAFFARRTTEPIREFEARARDVSAGAYVRPLVVDRDDEIGAMATAFNTMANRINMLQDVSQLLASSSETEHVLDGIISATAHLLRTGSVAVFLADEERRSLTLERASGLRRDVGDLAVPLTSDSVISRAFSADGPLTFTADAITAESDPALSAFGIGTARSGVAMPLVAGRETLGVVVVVSPGRREFSEADIEMIKTFSAQAAVAVRNSHLFNEEHVSRQEAEALRAVAELLVSSLDPTASLEQVGRIASSLLGVDDVLFAFWDRGSLDLRPVADRDREAALLTVLNAHAARSGIDPAGRTPVVVDDALADAITHDFGDRHGVGALMLVPLVAGGGQAGVMAFEKTGEPHEFSTRQVSLAVTLGNEVSLALENQYLLTRERSRAASLERIFRISQAVSSSLQVKTVLNRVLDVVQKIFSADAVSLMRFDAKRRVLDTTMARGIHTKDLLFFRCGPADDIPGAVYQSKAPLRLDSLDSQSTPFIELAREHGFRSLLSVPLIARGRAAGVLTVFSDEIAAFSEEDMDLLATFASQAALATDTAELFSKEHTVATVLKSSILPDTLPEIEGIEAFSVYRAAGGEAEIGGDYYDMFTANDGRVVLSIADVCGQGVRAATKTSMIRYSVRGMAAAGLEPNRMVSELNRVVVESGDTSDIVTTLLGLLDREKSTFVYANAGHPPGLLVRGDEIIALETTGPLLGAIAGIVFGQVEVALEPCDLIVLYTDGVTEARREGELFGEERLRAVVAEGGSPAEVTQRILSAVQSFSGELRDDVAVLAVRVSPRKKV
jgi:serine phosphatase RsbU (regulator of sigma subunit)/HAMP domain-containing protein